MIPVRIRLQGFLSYGKEAQTLRFDEAPLWLLAGPNGAGKSSVFDAIQFALYGSHRDGRQGLENLIHKEEDRFEIEVEFTAQNRTWCVRRSRDRKGNPTGEAFEVTGEGAARTMRALPEVNIATLEEWVQQTIGMSEQTFTASALLRQGGSDVLIEAKNAQRIVMLSELLHLSDYDRLYAKTEEKRKQWLGKQTARSSVWMQFSRQATPT